MEINCDTKAAAGLNASQRGSKERWSTIRRVPVSAQMHENRGGSPITQCLAVRKQLARTAVDYRKRHGAAIAGIEHRKGRFDSKLIAQSVCQSERVIGYAASARMEPGNNLDEDLACRTRHVLALCAKFLAGKADLALSWGDLGTKRDAGTAVLERFRTAVLLNTNSIDRDRSAKAQGGSDSLLGHELGGAGGNVNNIAVFQRYIGRLALIDVLHGDRYRFLTAIFHRAHKLDATERCGFGAAACKSHRLLDRELLSAVQNETTRTDDVADNINDSGPGHHDRIARKDLNVGSVRS